MTAIVFTPDEIRRWAYAGVDRRVSAMIAGRKGAHGFNRDDFWQLDLEGLLAEAAVAKHLGVHFSPVTGALDTASGDVGDTGLQVRSTKHTNGSLIIHESDDDHHKFILVTGSQGRYDVRGWCVAREVKLKEYWKVYKTRGSFWVPQSALRSMDEL